MAGPGAAPAADPSGAAPEHRPGIGGTPWAGAPGRRAFTPLWVLSSDFRELPTPARSQPGLGSARFLPCLRTNRPQGRAHVIPPPALQPLRKPEAAAAGKAGGGVGERCPQLSPTWNRTLRLRPACRRTQAELPRPAGCGVS